MAMNQALMDLVVESGAKFRETDDDKPDIGEFAHHWRVYHQAVVERLEAQLKVARLEVRLLEARRDLDMTDEDLEACMSQDDEVA